MPITFMTLTINLRPWLPILCLGFSAFIFVTTEMLPVGLLSDIATSLGKTEASTGLLLTVYAWAVAIMSLPLTIFTVRMNRRTLVLTLLGIFIVGNALSSMADSFATLLAARLCIALAHSVFWGIVPPLAVRVAPPGGRSRALAIIVTCTSLATVAGVPIGTLLGHHLGWRFAFAAVAGVAACVMALLWFILPSAPSTNAGSFRSLPALAHNKPLIHLYFLTFIAVTGHFTLFTYFSPVMEQMGGFKAPDVAFLLLVLGSAGILGSVAGSKYADHPGKLFLVIPTAVLTALILLMPVPLRHHMIGAGIFCFIWGMTYTFMTMVFQLRVLAEAAEYTDIATAIYSGTFNVGIGGGAFIGSLVFSGLGIGYVHYTSSFFLLMAFFLAALPFTRWRVRGDAATAEAPASKE